METLLSLIINCDGVKTPKNLPSHSHSVHLHLQCALNVIQCKQSSQ